MKIIITVLTIVIGFSALAQEPKKKKSSGLMNTLKKLDEITKSSEESSINFAVYADSLRQVRPGYEAVLFQQNGIDVSSKYYDHNKTNMPLQGYYITNDGKKVAAVIAYQKPEFLVGDFAAASSLYICKEANGKVVDVLNSNLEVNFKEYIKKDQIKAFFVGGQLFGKYLVKIGKNTGMGWRIVLNEGAIHSFANIFKSKNSSDDNYMAWKETQKLDNNPIGSFISSASTNVRLDMMEDAPEIVKSYNDGTLDIYEAEVTYNVMYELNSPGEVDYILGKDYGANEVTPAMAAKANREEQKKISAYDKEVVAAAGEANRVPRIDVFKGRPTTADASVASAKPEVPVKKESFKDRLNRIKADGNKVGVLVTCGNLVINPGSFAEGITMAKAFGNYGPLTGVDVLANTTTDRLNAGFGVDVFETVDYSKIPVREGKYDKLDDWWSTKYKVIVIYELSPFYNAYYKTNTETGDREYIAQMRVHTEMIVMAAVADKPDKLKYVTPSSKPWGYYASETYIAPDETDYHTIQELKAAINPPADDVVIKEIIKSQKEGLDKFVKKKSK